MQQPRDGRAHSTDAPSRNGIWRNRKFVVAGTAAAGIVIAAFVITLGSRESAPSIATSGIIQGNVLLRGPGESSWQELRDVRAPIVVGASLRTTQTGRLGLALTNGASFRLDAGTELTVADTRRFALTGGTVYIDASAASGDAAYVVEAPHALIDARQAQFEVSASDSGSRLRVRDGEVRIELGDTTEPVIASTGEQIRVSETGELARDYVMPYDSEWAWVATLAGTPLVDGRPLTQFLDWVARETGRTIRYDSPLTETSVATAMLSGSAENLSPMEALHVMLSMTDFDYAERWDGSIVISPRR